MKNPGEVPREFMPGRIPGKNGLLHGRVVISPRGDRIAWSVILREGRRPRGIIRQLVWDGNQWSGPMDIEAPGVLLPQAPAFDPAGVLYFQARHPLGPGNIDICRLATCESKETPVVLPGPLNSSGFEGQPSFTAAGDMALAVSLAGSGWNRGIALARKSAAGWDEPELLPPSVNSAAIDAYPCISPRGDYILFCSSRGGGGETNLRLMVSFRGDDGAWREPLDLGSTLRVNPPLRFPSLSPGGEILFFQQGNRVLWVQVDIIFGMREKKQKH